MNMSASRTVTVPMLLLHVAGHGAQGRLADLDAVHKHVARDHARGLAASQHVQQRSGPATRHRPGSASGSWCRRAAVDEFRSTITHSKCGQLLAPQPHDPTGREKCCPHCQVDVPRDIDAGRSIDSISGWEGPASGRQPQAAVVRTGRRPRSPSAAPRAAPVVD
jgi:hypothetical protein